MTPRRCDRHVTPEAAARSRHLGCRNTGVCLELAMARRWDGFSCGGCTSYAPQNREEQAADFEGLLELHRVLLAGGRPTRTTSADDDDRQENAR
jgi:hypothetical protein